MGKKDKNKKKNKDKKDAGSGKLKSKCCEKYKKGEHKRCKNCPKFDLPKIAD